MFTVRRDSRSERAARRWGWPTTPRRCALAASALFGLTTLPGARVEAQMILRPVPPPDRPVAYDAPWVPPVPGGTKCPPGLPVDVAVSGPAPIPVRPTPPPATCEEEQQMSPLHRFLYRAKRKHQAAWVGYPEEFNEWTLGRSVSAHMTTHVSNAQAASMVFYDYDFVQGTSELNLRGRDKLGTISHMISTTFYPVIIERTPWAVGLDQARRASILSLLAASSCPVPPERLLVGPPLATPRSGVEAVIVEGNRLGSVAAGGAAGGSAAAGIGTGSGANPFDGSGLSGGAVAPIGR